MFVSDVLPRKEAKHAGGTTIFNYIRSLSDQGHEIALITFIDRREKHEAEELKRHCERVIAIPRNRPLLSKLIRIPLLLIYPIECWRAVYDVRFSRSVKRLLEEFQPDLVQMEEPWMFFYAKHVQRSRRILDEHDVFLQIKFRAFLKERNPVKKILALAEFIKMTIYEMKCVAAADMVFTRSEKDRMFLRGLFPEADVQILEPWISFEKLLELPLVPPSERTILYFGDMGREVNIQAAGYFCDEVFPHIKKRVPDARFVIAGANPPREILKRGNDKDVNVTGYVPRMEDIYGACRVFVAPMLVGGGIIVKILDAMAAGRPVVTTRIGNEGIQAVDGEQLFVVHAAEAFAEQVVRLLEDDDLWRKTARAGRDFCTTKYKWDEIVQRVNGHYLRMMEQDS